MSSSVNPSDPKPDDPNIVRGNNGQIMYIKKINQPFSNPVSNDNTARANQDAQTSQNSNLPAMSKKFLANFADTSDEEDGTMRTEEDAKEYVATSKDHLN